MPLTDLNNYLLVHIFAFLLLETYVPLILTCQRFHNIITTNQSLLQSWCINKFPKHITATIPLPDGTDYNWLVKCLLNDLSNIRNTKVHKYGYLNGFDLHMRNIIRISNDQMLTRGIYINQSMSTYRIGTFVNDTQQGHGIFIESDKSYVGEFQDGYCYGLGTLTWKNGESYHGYFVDNRRSGLGTFKYINGCCYVGQWSDDKLHGNGSYHWANGNHYVGRIHNGGFHGLGQFSKYVDGQVPDVYFGLWDTSVPCDCEFGYLYYECQTCNAKVCCDCVKLHQACRSRKRWTVDASVALNCGHEKKDLSKIKG